MAAGLGVLALSPQAFWAMTPAELDAALRGKLGANGVVAPPEADDFASLMQRFPDTDAL